MPNNILQVTNLQIGTSFLLETGAVPGGALALEVQAANNQMESNTAITTVGNGSLTAAALLSGLVTRSGPTGAFTDTTVSAATIQAAWDAATGDSMGFTYINTTAFPATLGAGSGVTLAGPVIVPPNSTGSYLMEWTGTGAITLVNRSVASNAALPPAQYQTLNATTGSLPAGAITGSAFCALLSSNATPGAQLVRSAAQMLADIPNGAVGQSWRVRILNSGAGTFTLTTDAGATVTISGTATIAQNVFRDYVFTITSPTAATAQSIGSGVSP